MTAVMICSDFGAPKIKSDTVSTVSPSISHEVMGSDAMIFVFWMLSFKPTFSLSSFSFFKRLFGSSSLSAIRMVSSAYLRLLIFLPAIFIPTCALSSLTFLMMYSAYSHISTVTTIVIIVNKKVRNAVHGCNLKNDRMISVYFQGKPFNITVIQDYAPTSNAEEAIEWSYEDLQDLLELTPQKRYPFHYRVLECKSRKSTDTWSNSQIWLWSTEWSRAKANRVLPKEHTGQNKHPLPTTQEKTTHGHHQMVNTKIRLTICSQRWRSSIQSAKTRSGADCGSDHELLVAKFRLKLKKVGKTTRSFRYDLNQIPYDYAVEVRNRFKGLDLINRLPEELWMEVPDIVQEAGIKPIPKNKKCKKEKLLSEEDLQIAVKGRDAQGKGEKERYSHLNAEFQRIARRGKKALLSGQWTSAGSFLTGHPALLFLSQNHSV